MVQILPFLFYCYALVTYHIHPFFSSPFLILTFFFLFSFHFVFLSLIFIALFLFTILRNFLLGLYYPISSSIASPICTEVERIVAVVNLNLQRFQYSNLTSNTVTAINCSKAHSRHRLNRRDTDATTEARAGAAADRVLILLSSSVI